MTDLELLEQFRQGSADAFSAIVRRHVDWVYSAAKRRVRDAHQAEDVTQAVFITLAQKKPYLRSGTLSPWLFGVLIRVSKTALKRQAIRQRHESEAAKMRPTITPDPQADWDTIAPNLEEAVARLRYADQQAILLRFYEQLSFAEVGEMLGITEEAARKRVSRAGEKLREILLRKGLHTSASALTGLLLLSTTSARSAPLAMVEASVAAGTTGTAGGGWAALLNAAAIQKLTSMAGVALSSGVGLAAVVLVLQLQAKQTVPPAVVAATVPVTLPAADATATLLLDQAMAELSAEYALANKEVVRLISAPFPPSRTAWANLRFPEARGAEDVRSLGFSWSDGALTWTLMSYADQTVESVVRVAMGIREWYAVDGLDRIALQPLHADIVVRQSATAAEKLDALALLIRAHGGPEVRFVKHIRARPCIVLWEPPPRRLPTPANQRPVRNFPFQELVAKPLNAPFVSGDGRGAPSMQDVPDRPFPRMDVALNPADPDYDVRLAKIVEDIQKEVGGVWGVENREIETFVVEVVTH